MLGGIWRVLFNRSIKLPQRRVLILGDGEELEEITLHIRSNPQIGYEVTEHIVAPGKDHTAPANTLIPNVRTNVMVFRRLRVSYNPL